MKIINQTADEMVLKDGQPILGLFMGIIFMIVGGGLSYVTFIKKENILLSLVDIKKIFDNNQYL